MPLTILTISIVLEFNFLRTDCEFVVVLKFLEHHVHCLQMLPQLLLAIWHIPLAPDVW